MIRKGECMRRHSKTINQSGIFVHGGGGGGRGGAGNPSHTGIHKQLHKCRRRKYEYQVATQRQGMGNETLSMYEYVHCKIVHISIRSVVAEIIE